MGQDHEVVLITGASAGFGRLFALELARRGHVVCASMRDVQNRNAANRAELLGVAHAEGIDLEVVELDVTDDTGVDSAVDEIISRHGRIDVVVNNAGYGTFGLNETYTLEQIQQQFDTNFFGAVRVNRAVLPLMRARGRGLLVQISSVLGRVLWPFTGWYAATKHALEAMAESYRYDLSSFGIDSVIVQPGAYPTDLPSAVVGPGDAERVEACGEVAQMAVMMKAAGDEIFMEHAPDPGEVARVVADLIEMPAGRRPLRTRIGADTEVLQPFNDLSEAVQRQVFEAIGLSHMLGISPA